MFSYDVYTDKEAIEKAIDKLKKRRVGRCLQLLDKKGLIRRSIERAYCTRMGTLKIKQQKACWRFRLLVMNGF